MAHAGAHLTANGPQPITSLPADGTQRRPGGLSLRLSRLETPRDVHGRVELPDSHRMVGALDLVFLLPGRCGSRFPGGSRVFDGLGVLGGLEVPKIALAG